VIVTDDYPVHYLIRGRSHSENSFVDGSHHQHRIYNFALWPSSARPLRSLLVVLLYSKIQGHLAIEIYLSINIRQLISSHN
jgi:hypothetical protein